MGTGNAPPLAPGFGVNSAAFSPDGKRLAFGSGDGLHNSDFKPGEVTLWDVVTGKPIRTLRGHTSGVRCIAFSPDGKRLVSGGGGNDEKFLTVPDFGAAAFQRR
jgi:WD40 repeat protein